MYRQLTSGSLGSYKDITFVLPTVTTQGLYSRKKQAMGALGQTSLSGTAWLGIGAAAVAAWYFFLYKK